MSAKELSDMATTDGLKLVALKCLGDRDWTKSTFPADVSKLATC